MAAPDPRQALGRRGEALAEEYLRGLGYRIVGRRERVLGGDIDLVALDGRTVVFV
ncbi:MAG: YraN family protein, partial [Planctomycetaceae bacterium]